VFPVQEINSTVALEDIFGIALQQLFFADENAGISFAFQGTRQKKSYTCCTVLAARVGRLKLTLNILSRRNTPLPEINNASQLGDPRSH
jgi:hypothetical protein